MEYVVKHCPNCNGELHIPPDMKQCICMFCGERFEVQDPVSGDAEMSIEALEGDYQNALKHIAQLLENYGQYMKDFTKDSYSTSFERYVQTGIRILQPIRSYASFSEEKSRKAVKEASSALVAEAVKMIEGEQKGIGIRQKRSVRKTKIEQYRYFLAVYTVPMIRYLNYGISEAMADSILENWGIGYPKYMFQKGTFEELQTGFKKKSFFGLKN